MLLRVLLDIIESNLSIVVKWNHKMINDNTTLFRRVFQAFEVAIKGFKYYCPLIRIDDTHFYKKYKTKLLIEVAYNKNNRFFFL